MSRDDSQGVSAQRGFPNPALDSSLPTLDFNQLLIRHHASTYMFRVQGSEWEDAGVFDGDIAVVDRALDPLRTDTVIWWDEPKGEFAISKKTAMPRTATLWGVVTASVHQFRKTND
jgi:DNA polymerase V